MEAAVGRFMVSIAFEMRQVMLIWGITYDVSPNTPRMPYSQENRPNPVFSGSRSGDDVSCKFNS